MDEIGISASVHGDINAALGEIEHNLDDVGDAAAKMGAKARVGGEEAAKGIGKAEKASRQARDENVKLAATGQKVSSTQREITRDSLVASTALDKFGKAASKAARRSGGLAAILTMLKFAAIATGGYALVGMLIAVGNAAVIAVGGLAPMVGIVAALGPMLFALGASMAVFKIAGEQVKATMKPLGDAFKSYAGQINAVLLPGLNSMVKVLRGELVPVLGGGLVNVADIIGYIADDFGRWGTQAHQLNRLGSILQSMSPIMRPIANGLMSILSALLDVVHSALPMTAEMVAGFERMAARLAGWTNAMDESGRMAAWLTKSWEITKQVGSVLADVIVGLYNIFRIAGGFAGQLGDTVATTTQRFREWTQSAEGQQRITKYFQDALPAMRETAMLLGAVVAGFARMATSPNVAPLLEQIRTELVPAIGQLVEKMSGGGGLFSATVDAATALTQMFAGLDFSGITTFMQAIAGVAMALTWLATNVPGANFVISGLLMSMLGFKLLGPVFSMVGKGASAFAWVWTAARGTKELSFAQKLFKGVLFQVWTGLRMVSGAFGTLAAAGLRALASLSVALLTTPVGWVILAIMLIIGVIVLLWFKCEWFRDAVTAVWQWIAKTAVDAWNWLKEAFFATTRVLGDAARAVGQWFVDAWNWIKDAGSSTWSAVTGFVQGAIDTIAGIALWLWTNAIKPVWDFIAAGARIAWAIISFIVGVAIYTIAALITGLAWSAEIVWKAIVAGAKWFYDVGIKPVVDGTVAAWNWLTGLISAAWGAIVAYLSERWTWLYANVIAPVIQWITDKWNYWTTVAQVSMQIMGDFLMGIWNWIYNNVIAPVINYITEKWNYWTTVAQVSMQIMGDTVSGIWNWIQGFIGNAIDWVSRHWESAMGGLADFFRPIGAAIGVVWDGIKSGASAAAEIVKGAWDTVVGAVKGVWNSIARVWNNVPSIPVPDWVPGMGGHDFSLPKLPTLWHGGEAPGGPALVGELGPEPIVTQGRVDWVGLNGPEILNLPKGGHVVPNLDTLKQLPGLTKSLPNSVANAVARSVPGYADVLGRSGLNESAMPPVVVNNSDPGLRDAVKELAGAVREQAPPINVGNGDVRTIVREELRRRDRERDARKRYEY